MTFRELNNDIYFGTVLPRWSRAVNTYYRWRLRKTMPEARARMAWLADRVRREGEAQNIPDTLRTLLKIIVVTSRFRYARDTFRDWVPEPDVYFARGETDDCDGAAVAAEFVFHTLGIPCNRIILLGRPKWRGLWSEGNHAVCVTNDLEWMVSNNQVMNIGKMARDRGWTDPETIVLAPFGGEYVAVWRNPPSRGPFGRRS